MLGEANRWDSGEGRRGHGGFIVFGTYFVCRFRALAMPLPGRSGEWPCTGLSHSFNARTIRTRRPMGVIKNAMFAD